MATIPRRRWDTLVAEVCDEFGLLPEHVSRRKRKQVVQGTGMCRCTSCSKVWSSHRFWILVDCKEQRIIRNWKQKCLLCKTDGSFFACKETSLRQSIRLAVLKCVEQVDGIYAFNGNGDGPDESDIHKHSLCEKCEYGRGPDCQTGAPLESGLSAPSPRELEEPHPIDPLPPQFIEDRWKSWQDVNRLLVTREKREARAKAFHAVKVTLKAQPELAIVKVFESGSVATGTQLPLSDIDIVLFIEDFDPGRDFISLRLNAVLGYLQAHLQPEQNLVTTVVYERDVSADGNRYSRKFRILETSSGERFKVDVLLGGQLLSPRDFLQLPVDLQIRRAWSASSSKFQREFVRKWTQPASLRGGRMSQEQITCRNAILAFKHWKKLVAAPTEHAYFPSYLIELVAIRCFLSGTEDDKTRVGSLFAAMLGCVAVPEQMMIDFTAQNECRYGREDLDRGLPGRQEPSVADPGNPTNDMARPHHAIGWDTFWGLRASEARDSMLRAGAN